MRTAVEIASRPGFSVSTVTCHDDHARWSAPEPGGRYGVVLARRGRFRRRADGRAADVDSTAAYFSTPEVEEQFAHPDGGDVCTSLEFTPELWRSIAGERSISRAIYVDARVELTHRRLLRATADVDYALAEQLVRLLVLALGTEPPEHADAALVASAREAVLADHPAASGLVPLAEHFGVSPFRLSRAFSRVTGVSLTRYRNRVRVGRALERLEGGDTALAELAAELGFADQAHLTRTMREHSGHSPMAVRRLLTTNGGYR
ncbi:helix-turn-helix domain-containing protein [Amycolatopsis sp. NPDC059657]|uniref:helix-turn-helix domain-containing protein n=1 Tax=Amycolatopsis sp. NPDC059657 TaxID=3346899 RepID=UPI0036707B10